MREDTLGDGEAVRSTGVARRRCRSSSRSPPPRERPLHREVISLEVFESINELHLWIQSPGRARLRRAPLRLLPHVRARRSSAGPAARTMLHDAPLDFIWLGVMLERRQTARILDVHHHAFTTAAAARRRRARWWRSRSGVAVARLLRVRIVHEEPRGAVSAQRCHRSPLGARFPRSVRHCLRRARERLEQIRRERAIAPLRAQERLRRWTLAEGSRARRSKTRSCTRR